MKSNLKTMVISVIIIFLISLQSFSQNNDSYKSSTVTGFGSMPVTPEQLRNAEAKQDSMYKDYLSHKTLPKITTIPNWQSMMSDVENQGACGDCWVHAATGVTECQLHILIGENINIDMDELEIPDACYGGWAYIAEYYILNYKMRSEVSSYPNLEGIRWGIASYNSVSGINNIKSALENGPVTAAFDMRTDFPHYFDNDHSAVYRWDGSSPHSCYHAVVIVSYGEDEIGEYWLCKNSGGSDWADYGYFRIGFGQCYIESMENTYVTVNQSCLAKIIPNLISSLTTACSYGFINNEWAVILDDITINNGTTCTVPSGAYIAFQNGYSLTVNGVINAEGNSSEPIVFTSASSTTPGSWQYVRVTNGNSVFKYCTFEYGTVGLSLYNADSGDPVAIENCTFKNNSYYGLDILGSNAILESCYIYNNTYSGIYCTYGSDIDLVGNLISNNGSLGINSYYYNELELYGNVIENNSSHGIHTGYGDNTSIGAVYDWWGYNTIRENGGDEINTDQYDPNLLEISGASIHDDSGYEIYNYAGNSAIEARSGYWDDDRYDPYCCQYSGSVTLMATIYCELPEWDGQTRTSGSPLGKIASSLQAGEIEWYWDPNISDAEKIQIGKDIISSNPESSEGKEALRRIYSIIRADYRNNNLGEREKFFDYLKSIQTKYPDFETGKLALKYMIVWKILERDYASIVRLSNKALEQFNGQDKKLVLVGLALTYINTGQVTEARNILQTLHSKYDDDEKLTASLEFEIANVELSIANGQYKYEENAKFTKIGTNVPHAIELMQNYPNPFNPCTIIRYALPVKSDVQLIIYDIMGREVKTLVSSKQDAGYKEVVWNGTDNNNQKVSSGIYIYRLRAVSTENLQVFDKSAKLVLLK